MLHPLLPKSQKQSHKDRWDGAGSGRSEAYVSGDVIRSQLLSSAARVIYLRRLDHSLRQSFTATVIYCDSRGSDYPLQTVICSGDIYCSHLLRPSSIAAIIHYGGHPLHPSSTLYCDRHSLLTAMA